MFKLLEPVVPAQARSEGAEALILMDIVHLQVVRVQ